MKPYLVFLGGTVAGNGWRKKFIRELTALGVPHSELFNPVVEEWNEEAQAKEEEAKKNATHMLFFLGAPMQDGNPLSTYSMIEATMALYDAPEKTVVVFDPTGIGGHALKAYKQTEKVLRKRFPDKRILSTLGEAIAWFADELV